MAMDVPNQSWLTRSVGVNSASCFREMAAFAKLVSTLVNANSEMNTTLDMTGPVETAVGLAMWHPRRRPQLCLCHAGWSRSFREISCYARRNSGAKKKPAEHYAPPAVSHTLLAVCKLRRSYLSAPVEGCCGLVELGGVPEGTAVLVYAHGTVVAPAVGSIRLGTSASHHLYFFFQLAQRIGSETASQEYGWIHRGSIGASISAGFTVTHEDISHFVHGDRTHPSPIAIGSVGSLLMDPHRGDSNPAVWRRCLKPAHTVLATRRSNVKVRQPVLRRAVVVIGEAIHQAPAKRIDQISDSFLRNAIPTIISTCWVEERDRQQLRVAVAGEGRAFRPVVGIVNVCRVKRQVSVIYITQAADEELVFPCRRRCR